MEPYELRRFPLSNGWSVPWLQLEGDKLLSAAINIIGNVAVEGVQFQVNYVDIRQTWRLDIWGGNEIEALLILSINHEWDIVRDEIDLLRALGLEWSSSDSIIRDGYRVIMPPLSFGDEPDDMMCLHVYVDRSDTSGSVRERIKKKGPIYVHSMMLWPTDISKMFGKFEVWLSTSTEEVQQDVPSSGN